MTDTKPQLLHHGNYDGGLACSHAYKVSCRPSLGFARVPHQYVKTALNKNIIPHTWKFANIVPIPKPNKDTYKGTSYWPISLLSVIEKTLEKNIIPYITANI